ncbi:MAG: glycosyl transferase, partial [Acidobacteriaceae bacterium]
AMVEGWTKNLALLFGNSLAVAAWRMLDFLLLFGLPALLWWTYDVSSRRILWVAVLLLWLRTLWRFYRRVARSNFPARDWVLSPVALPLFAALLYRSWFQHTVLKRVSWKGREYGGS